MSKVHSEIYSPVTRLSNIGGRPVRILHRGDWYGAGEAEWYNEWKANVAYGVDSVVTGLARPLVAPVVCACKAMRNTPEGAAAILYVPAAALAGASWGLGKGCLGMGVSFGVGAFSLLNGLCVSGLGMVPLGRAVYLTASVIDDIIVGG